MRSLTEIRKEKGISQRHIADALGITSSALSLYEKGKRKVPIEVAQYYLELDSGIQNKHDAVDIFQQKGNGLKEKASRYMATLTQAEKIVQEEIVNCLPVESKRLMNTQNLSRIIEDTAKALAEGRMEQAVRAAIRTGVKLGALDAAVSENER